MNRYTALILFLGTSVLSLATAGAADPFDLGSIGLHPSYLSASTMRANATLHAVAMAPVSGNSQNERRPERSIGIAVGDGGTILRTDDAGVNWRLIDRITPLAEFEEAPGSRSRFGSRRPERPVIAMPAWHFYDLKWLSPSDVVVIGGGFEPITGISRGVCLFSADAGATWSMGNAHELPRLKHFATEVGSRRSGMIEAFGDRAEASGVDRFFSQDGGRTWIEATVVTDSLAAGADALNRVDSRSSKSLIQVSDYGRIRLNENGTWRTVRGQDRHAAIAFVCGSAQSTPWSLIGRESLHENNRVVVALADRTRDSMKSHRWGDAAKMLGATVGKLDRQASKKALHEWLQQHGPTVLALDASLPESVRQDWMDAVASVRQQHDPDSSLPNSSLPRSSLQRVVLVRSNVAGQTGRDTSVFKRSSTLRSDALLTGPAVLAGDFASDALMIAAPGTPTPAVTEVTTLDDLSGAIRRDISMTSGITLSDGQVLGENERHVAANRRLQIATARVAQVTNLRNQLAGMITKEPNVQLQASVEQTLRNVIAMTAPADQTRLLWDRLVELMNRRGVASHHMAGGSRNHPSLSMVRSVIRQQLTQMATPASIQRWAEFAEQATISSVEREQMTRVEAGVSKQWASSGATDEIRQASNEEPVRQKSSSNAESMPRGHGGGLSPFQVAPASYTTPTTGMRSPTAILIPERKTTTWQTPRGMAVNHASEAPKTSGSTDHLQRTNWDYHPIVMAGRKIGQTESAPATPSLLPPMVTNRPYLDGKLDDPCWTQAVSFESVKVAQGQNFYFIAIVSGDVPNSDSIRVRLDCDGDYLTSIELGWDGVAIERTTVDGLREVAMTCYGSGASTAHLPAQVTPQRTIELAIAKRDLPGPLHRIRVDQVGVSSSPWEAMPDETQWFPRQ